MSLFKSPTKPGPFRVERIRLKLQGFDFNVVHKPGKWNPSDYLSRHPLPARHLSAEELEESQELECHLLKALQIPSALSLYEIQEESSVDPIVSKIISGLKTDTLKVNPAKDYAKVIDQLSIAHGILLQGARMVIPPSLVKKVVHIGHEGHQGIVKTKQLLRSLVWFPNMDKLIEKHITKCTSCQASVNTPIQEPMQSTVLPNYPWQCVDVDFIGPLPSGVIYLLFFNCSHLR